MKQTVRNNRMFGRMGSLSVLGAIGLVLGLAAISAEEEWPQWRGPHRTGIVGGESWPASLGDEGLTKQWRVPLAEGYPGPIVSNGRVFSVESEADQFETVRAFDQQSGRLLWKRSWEGAMKVPFFAAKNGSWVKSTPATDGESILVGGMRADLVSLDVESGKVNWSLDLASRLKSDRPSFGFVCSPLIVGEHTFVQAGGGVAKLKLATGEVVWHVAGGGDGMSSGAFSSPMIGSVGGVEQLVVQERAELRGMALQDGRLLWRQPVKAFRGMNIVTPVAYGDGFFTTTYGGRSRFWSVRRKDGAFSVENPWDNKLQGYMSTPVVIDGHAYFHLRNQRAACVDLSSGEIAWVTDERFGKYWSIVGQGDRLLALDEAGELILFRANPERFELIDRREVSDSETWGHLAVVEGQLFIRELDGLSAWRWSENPQLASKE